MIPSSWNVVPTATHEEWLAARQRYLTASDVAAVMGLSPYGSRARVLKSKLAPPVDLSTSAMRAGQFLEDGVFAWFLDDLQRTAKASDGLIPVPTGERCRGEAGQSLLVAHPDPELALAASPDAILLTGGERALVEVKVTNPDAWADWAKPNTHRRWAEYAGTTTPPSDGACPLRHWVQLQVQLLVTGESWGWVVGVCGTQKRPSVFPAHPAFQARIMGAARQFALDVAAARRIDSGDGVVDTHDLDAQVVAEAEGPRGGTDG